MSTALLANDIPIHPAHAPVLLIPASGALIHTLDGWLLVVCEKKENE